MKKLLKACLQHFYRGGVQYNRLLSSLLFLALLFIFSCKNQTNSQTDKPNIPPDIPPKQDEIVITVLGDSNVKVTQSPSFNVLKNSTWASVKVKANQKISFSDGFVLKSWHLTNKDGKLLVDTEVFTENTTVFAVSEKENSPEEPEKPVRDEDGNEIKEEIIGEEGKDKEVKAIIEVVEVKEEGKEKPTTKLKISGNILSDETKRIANILRSQVYEYKNKKDEVKSIEFDALTNNSTLNIQFKDESKKINVEDLKILVAKIPNQVKIDNEDCVTLDKTANITSIKGTVSLMDIVKGANSSSELTKWEFISDKIKEQSSINSDNLAITSKEGEKFNTENLKKVANTLSKTEITNTTTNGNQTVTLGQNAKISSINGNIALKDIIEAKNETNTELANYIAYKLKNTPSTESPSGDLKINTFYKKPSTIQGSSLSLRGNNNEPESTPITPKVLNNIKNSALNSATLNFKDGNKTIPVSFQSSKTDAFNITDFSNEIKTGKFKDINETSVDGNIFLLSKERKIKIGQTEKTTYSNITELLTLINNEKLKSNLVIGNTYVVGKEVKDLLPHLVGPDKIKEEDGGIKFLNKQEFGCDENTTRYDGGKNNNKGIPIAEFIEFRKRTDEKYDSALETNSRSLDIDNLILENVDTTNMSEDDLKFLNFSGDVVGGKIIFRGGNLSKMTIEGMSGPASVIFEETTLPSYMYKTSINNLTLKKVTIPKEFSDILQGMGNRSPYVRETLKVYDLKGNFFNISEDNIMDNAQAQKYAPKKYVGPENIWNKLKLLYLRKNENNEPTKTHFTNDDLTNQNDENINFTSLHKPKGQLLAILKKRQERSHG